MAIKTSRDSGGIKLKIEEIIRAVVRKEKPIISIGEKMPLDLVLEIPPLAERSIITAIKIITLTVKGEESDFIQT